MAKQKIIFRRVKYLEQTNRTIVVAHSSRFRIVMKLQIYRGFWVEYSVQGRSERQVIGEFVQSRNVIVTQ